jgi:CRISPR-associated protein Csb2
MALILEQTFPLGRFHATRWNQNPFEDRFGEWPPSPWRLLRALAARWFQYSRETGDADTATRDRLLRTLAGCIPTFCVPELTWRGAPLRQYHRTGLEGQYKYRKDRITKKQVLDYSFKQIGRTMVVHQYRAVPDSVPLYWVFELPAKGLGESEYALLGRLVERTLYFGRVESHSRLRIVPELPAACSVNCTLSSSDRGNDPPVLVADPATPLDVAALLVATDDNLIARRPIPPGTRWYYAQLPPLPRLSPIRAP